MAIVKTAEIVIKSNAGETKNDVDSLDNSVDGLTQSTNTLTKATEANKSSFISSNQVMSVADKFTGGYASTVVNTAKSTGLLSTAQKSMTVATGGATTAMQIFKVALATSGIGLIVLAVGLLVEYFMKLNPVMDVVEQGLAAIGAVINTVQQALAGLFSGDLSGFETLGDDMSKASKAAIELTETLQNLEDVQKEMEVTNAKFKNQYDELILQSKNRTLSEQERINKLKQADALERSNYEQRKTIANQVEQAARQAIINEANLTQAEAVELMKRGVNYKTYAESRLKNADELFSKLGEAQKANLSLENESIAMRTKSQNKQDALAEKIQAEKEKREQEARDRADKARQKREAAEEKARQIRATNDKAYQDARIKLLREIEDLEDTTEEQKTARRKAREIETIKALKGQSEEAKKILLDSLDQKYLLEAQNANNKAFIELEKKLQADLKALQNQSDQQKLNDRKEVDLKTLNALKGKSDAEIAQLKSSIDTKYALEQAELDKKNEKDIQTALDKVDSLKTYTDAQTLAEVQAIQDKSLATLEAQRVADEAMLIQKGATEEQLIQLNASYAEKNNEEKQKANERQRQLEQVKYEFTKKMATDGINLVDSLEKIGIVKGKAAAKAKKALTLVQIGADTASAISSLVAYSNSAGAAAGPAGLAVSIATYAAGGLQILGNIAKAKKLLSAGDGDSGGTSGGSSAPSAPSAPRVGFQTSPQSQLQNTISASNQQQPVIKTYVVSKDVTTNQELDRNITDNAKF